METVNYVLESSVVRGEWRSDVVALLYEGKEESTACKNYRSINLLIVEGKIYAENI